MSRPRRAKPKRESRIDDGGRKGAGTESCVRGGFFYKKGRYSGAGSGKKKKEEGTDGKRRVAGGDLGPHKKEKAGKLDARAISPG